MDLTSRNFCEKLTTADEIGQRTDLTLVQNALKLDTADDIGDRKSNTQNGYLKTTADEIGEEYTLIGLIRMKPFH